MRTRIAALCGALALAGCSDSGNLLAPERLTVFEHEAEFGNLERFRLFATDFTVPAGGTLQITVDWTSASNDIDLVLSNPSCDATAFSLGVCKVLATEQSNTKPSQLTMATTATAYRLFVVNRGPTPESGTVRVAVTQTRFSI